MELLSFGCTRYKAFREPVTVELKPLILVLGRNNSGKSALLRLPQLLLQALSRDAPRNAFPLEAAGLSFGRTFRDILHAGQPHGSARFEVACRDGDEKLTLGATVQHVQAVRSRPGRSAEHTVVSELSVHGPGIDIELAWKPSADVDASYEARGRVPFRGLLPEGGPFAALEPWRDRLQDLKGRITHLGPLRAPIERSYSKGEATALAINGAQAPTWLASDQALLTSVSDWFVEHMDGWRFDVDPAGNAFACTLSRRGITVNLADAGQGAQQVLPIVTQQLLRQRESTWFLDLIEQPELHIHSAGHAPLGDLFVDTARQGVGCVLVETHSENLLLRVRRRVAEKRLAPDQVALYWCDDRPQGDTLVRRIHLGADGGVDYWPDGVFSEGFEEIKALSRATRIPA